MKRRNPSKVLITGIAGNLGKVVAAELSERAAIVGVDRRSFSGGPNIEHARVDLRKRGFEELFSKHRFSAIVHLGIMHDPRMSAEDHHSFNVLGTSRVFDFAVRYGVKKVVLLSSAHVYGPAPENSNYLTEDAPLMAASRFPLVRDLVAVDMLAMSLLWKHPEIEVVLLRPVHIVGPTIRNATSNYLRLHRPWMMAGFDPMVQLIHVHDVARATDAALKKGVRGVFNVAGPGAVPLSTVLRELDASPLVVPHTVARPMLRTLFRLGFASYPAEELDHLLYLCMVDDGAWTRQTGFTPKYTLQETIHAPRMSKRANASG